MLDSCCEGREGRAYGEAICDVDSLVVFLWVPHVLVDIRKHAVASPRRHEKSEAERDRPPRLREQIGRHRIPQASRCFRFDPAVGKYDHSNYQ